MANFLRADPYAVTVVDLDFVSDILQPLFARDNDWAKHEQASSRWGKYGDGWVTLSHLTKYLSKVTKKDHWVGAFFRAKTDDLPSKVTKDGISPLDIEEDDGVGEHVAFTYDVDRQVLWLQRDARIGRHVISTYLRERLKKTVTIDPIYGNDAPARARKLSVLSTIDFAYEIGNDPDADLGPFGFLDTFKRYGFGRIEIRMTRERRGALKPPAKELVGSLSESVEAESSVVTKAQIGGKLGPDAEAQVIDLINDRTEFKAPISATKMRDVERLMAVTRQIFFSNQSKVD